MLCFHYRAAARSHDIHEFADIILDALQAVPAGGANMSLAICSNDAIMEAVCSINTKCRRVTARCLQMSKPGQYRKFVKRLCVPLRKSFAGGA